MLLGYGLLIVYHKIFIVKFNLFLCFPCLCFVIPPCCALCYHAFRCRHNALDTLVHHTTSIQLAFPAQIC